MSSRHLLSFLLLAGCILFPKSTFAQDATVKLYRDSTLISSFTPFTDITIGSVALGDLGDDGIAEILVGAGYGSKPTVGVFRQDGTLIGSFSAYTEAFTGGVYVAACDLDGDGQQEIVTGAGFGGGPHVRIFTSMGEAIGGFFAYDAGFTGGVNIACGDVTGDGKAEIITGSGPGGGPHLKVFSATGKIIDENFVGSKEKVTGLLVNVGNADADAELEIITAPAAYDVPVRTIFDTEDGSLKKISETTLSSAATQPRAMILQQKESISGSPAFSTTASISLTNGTMTTFSSASDAFLALASGSDNNGNLIVAGNAVTPLFADVSAKYIRVDVSEQRLRAYVYGIPAFSFLISSGTYSFPTPLGKTAVLAKLPVHDYSWYYGAGNRNNYSLPNVKWNLRFRNHYYIHSAYWHNNFGHRMSHGCVNTSLLDAEKVYNWAEIGTPVEIIP